MLHRDLKKSVNFGSSSCIKLLYSYCSLVISCPRSKLEMMLTFFVRDLTEKNFFFSDTLKLNKPTVLSFFATWCGPCRAEMPIIDAINDEPTRF